MGLAEFLGSKWLMFVLGLIGVFATPSLFRTYLTLRNPILLIYPAMAVIMAIIGFYKFYKIHNEGKQEDVFV